MIKEAEMRLIECYIENFGKICKQNFKFDKEFNCISGDNGMGKTTLAAFIKAMLYGFNETKKASLEENDRKHYLPWQGGTCGGSLTFSIGERVYRIERSFGAKAADDTLAVYDTATGRACLDFGENPGESIFGIDADGFERTVFLSERALTPKSDNKSISAKLSDLVGCDGDIGGMDQALKTLEERRKFYYKKGGAGEIGNTHARIIEVTRKLERLAEIEIDLESTEKDIIILGTQLKEAREEEAKILKEREALTLKAAGSDARERLTLVEKELKDAKERQSRVAEIFCGNIPSSEEIDRARDKASELKSLLCSTPESAEEKRYKHLRAKYDGSLEKSDIDNAKATLARLSEARAKGNDPTLLRARRVFANRIPEKSEIERIGLLLSKAKGFPLALVFYAVFAIVGVLGIIINPIIAVIGLVGLMLTAVVDVTVNGKKKKANKEKINSFFISVCGTEAKDKDEAEERLADMTRLLPIIIEAEKQNSSEELLASLKWISDSLGGQPIEEIIREYDEYTQLAIAYKYIITEKEAKAVRARELSAEVEAFAKRFKTCTTDIYGELRVALTEYLSLEAIIKTKTAELNSLTEQTKTRESSEQEAKAGLKLLNERKTAIDERIADLSRQITLKERTARGYQDELDEKDTLFMSKAELEEQYKKYDEHYAILQKTKKYLTEARDNMTSKYLGKTKAGFLKYTEIIGGIVGESFEMDTDFGVTKQEGASTRTVEAYSRGTRDLFNLASRLALVDSLYEREKPFIILDDPFTAFDDGKTEAALKLMREFAKDRQVIYFTCSSSRSI